MDAVSLRLRKRGLVVSVFSIPMVASRTVNFNIWKGVINIESYGKALKQDMLPSG